MKEITFEVGMQRLQDIVHALEKEDVTLRDSMQLFEEGLQLVEVCDDELKQFDLQIEQLMIKHDQNKGAL